MVPRASVVSNRIKTRWCLPFTTRRCHCVPETGCRRSPWPRFNFSLPLIATVARKNGLPDFLENADAFGRSSARTGRSANKFRERRSRDGSRGSERDVPGPMIRGMRNNKTTVEPMFAWRSILRTHRNRIAFSTELSRVYMF